MRMAALGLSTPRAFTDVHILGKVEELANYIIVTSQHLFSKVWLLEIFWKLEHRLQ